MKRLLLLLLLAPLLALAAPRAIELKALDPGAFSQIRSDHQGRPFIVALWGLDCPHCMTDLRQLADFAARHAGTRLIIINTDSMDESAAIQARLRQTRLAGAENWVFGAAAPERLRFEIDRKWHGELPRTYLFDADGSSRAFSGPAAPAELADWRLRNSPDHR